MTNPDPLREAFADYTGDITAATDTGGADRLWRKAKRRRAGRIAVAGVAALALTGSATWALQQTVAAEEEAPAPAAANETTADDAAAAEENADEGLMDRYADEAEYLASLGPSADLIGTALDLPSFVPGNADVDAVCGRDGVELGDGTYEEPTEPGSVFLKKTVAGALAGDGGSDWAQVGLFGCRYGEETLYQAVVLAEAEDGTWTAGDRLVHSVPGGESAQYLQTTQDKGVLVGFAERYEAGANDLDFWLESVGFDADGAPVREVVSELDGTGVSDLAMRFEVTETAEAGVWTVSLQLRNNGPRDVLDHELRVNFDEEVAIESGAPLDEPDWGPWTTFAIEELGVGEAYTQEWTVAVGEDPDDTFPTSLNADFKAVASWEERGELARTVLWGQGGTQYYFWE